MKTSALLILAVTFSVCSFATPAEAVDSSIDRSIQWSDGVVNAVARPLIVTASNPPAGGDRLTDPADTATSSGVDLSGVARLFLDVDPAAGSGAVCSGSLLDGGQFLLTAAHCVTDENGGLAVIDNVDGNVATFETATGDLSAAFSASDITVHPLYDGDVRDGFDVAVIDLGQVQPNNIARYALNDGLANEAAPHLAAGFGQSGDGNSGATIGAGAQRSGFNNFVAAGLPIGNINNQETQLTADFDSGLSANDAFDVFDEALFGVAIDDPFNQGLGFGSEEIGVAPGDSGGPSFIQGANGLVIAGVHSYGLRLELVNGVTSDLDGALNSSFGEFYVDARVSNSEVLGFIRSVAIPEPTALSLLSLGVVLAEGLRRRVQRA